MKLLIYYLVLILIMKGVISSLKSWYTLSVWFHFNIFVSLELDYKLYLCLREIESPFVSFYTIIKFAEWYVLLMFKKAFDNHNEIFVHFGESLSEAVKTRKQLILHERRLLKRSSLCGITSMHELVAVLFPHWLVRGWKK